MASASSSAHTIDEKLIRSCPGLTGSGQASCAAALGWRRE